MIRLFRAIGVAASLAALGSVTTGISAVAQGPGPKAPAASPADVEFMSGMIPHHAQAVRMAVMAKSHGARSDVLALCERIVVGQADEIRLMQFWLREKGAPVPAADAKGHKMVMNGVEHEMLMPGMLTEEQMTALDKARGSEWDRLFLEGMIGHHFGAVQMVDKLLGSTNAAQDDLVYKMASDIYADQTTEIRRMEQMLSTVPGATSGRTP